MNIEEEIRKIQNGHFDRTSFPESMKGAIATRIWNDAKFSLGMEYGALLILNKLSKEKTEGRNQMPMHDDSNLLPKPKMEVRLISGWVSEERKISIDLENKLAKLLSEGWEIEKTTQQ